MNLFRGRMSKKNFFLFGFLPFLIVTPGFLYLVSLLRLPPNSILSVLFRLLALGYLFVFIRFCILRLHDIGKPGYWLLATLIPVLGLIMMAYILFWGSDKSNKYGTSLK